MAKFEELPPESIGTPIAGNNWLRVYLVDAIVRKLCIKIPCTTCGALEFRQGLLDALASVTGEPTGPRLSERNIKEFVSALAELTPERLNPSLWAFEDAVRRVLYDFPADQWRSDPTFRRMIDGAWVGQILAGIRASNAAAEASERAHEELQKQLRAQAKAKKRLKQEQHQARLALKKDRDRLWFEKIHKSESS